MERLTPFVFWAQKESTVSLRIDLRDVEVPNIELSENALLFAARGHGAKGVHIYEFSLNFHHPINKEDSRWRVTDRQVEFTIQKLESDWWPRLTNDVKKPLWLKIDFDKWMNEDDDDEDQSSLVKQAFENNHFNKDLVEKMKERGKVEYPVEFFRKFYLFLYNMFQFILYTYALLSLLLSYNKQGPEFMNSAYRKIGFTIKFCQCMQILEIIHPMLGFTVGNIFAPFIQVTARFMFLFLVISGEPRMHTKPAVFYVFVIWSAIEVVRYSYYLLKVWEIELKIITWLRYSLWIPLYPLGFICEGILILRSIPYFEETKKYSLLLPNNLNFSFSFYASLKIFLLIGIFPTMSFLMVHMYRQRKKKLGLKSWGKKD